MYHIKKPNVFGPVRLVLQGSMMSASTNSPWESAQTTHGELVGFRGFRGPLDIGTGLLYVTVTILMHDMIVAQSLWG